MQAVVKLVEYLVFLYMEAFQTFCLTFDMFEIRCKIPEIPEILRPCKISLFFKKGRFPAAILEKFMVIFEEFLLHLIAHLFSGKVM